LKALSLFSGGLDSQLAVMLIKEQGIDVIGLHFTTPFFGGDDNLDKAAADLGIELLTIDISDDYIPLVLLNPVYGYGKNFNPCIDCHAYMERTAGNLMDKLGASFMFSGEVLGQRPMSQNKSALNAVDKLCGYKGYMLRPLSARLLNETIPERMGWVNREQLLGISGRGRVPQMELAEKFGIIDYPSPAGGCLLTEPNFARRLRHMLQYVSEPSSLEMQILRLGRHFYIEDGFLLVVGRNHSENERLSKIALNSDLFIKAAHKPGPLAILRSLKNEDSACILEYAASITARYGDGKNDSLVQMKIIHPGIEDFRLLDIKPMPAEEIPPTV